MKVTKSQLKNIIMEEINKCLNEWDYYSSDGNYQESIPSYDSKLVYKDAIFEYVEDMIPRYLKKTGNECNDKLLDFQNKNPQLYDEFSDLSDKDMEVTLYGFDGTDCDDVDIYINPEFKQFLETKLKQQEPELYQYLTTQIFDEDTIKEVYCGYAEATEDGRYVPDEPEYDRDFNWDD